jgi:hypothetical protein
MDRNGYLLLVQEDKRHLETVDPEPQLIAEAIAAVQSNNRTRNLSGLEPLDIKVMAGLPPQIFHHYACHVLTPLVANHVVFY